MEGISIVTQLREISSVQQVAGEPDIGQILHLLASEGAALAPDIIAFLTDKIHAYQAGTT